MRRIAITLFVTAAWPTITIAADAPRLPTSPQVPAPTAGQERSVRPASAAGRANAPAKALLGPSHNVNEVANSSDQPWIAPSVEEAPCTTSGRGCGTSIIAGSPIKSWLCFRPTTAHALPWLRPHPYVGPITGQFHCSPAACPQCEGAPACAAGTGCGKGLGGGRGCRNGDCIPPAEGSFPGYKFAQPLAPAISGRAAPTTSSTSYKPSIPPTGGAAPAAPRTGTVLESFKRTASKP
jgi:hypothetical protein